MEFRHFVQLIAIGLQARIPMHMTGFPGVGKTEFTKSLETGFDRVGIKCKVMVLVGSIREPQDFGGFPVSTPDGVRLLPMAWARDAQRLAEEGYLVVVFLDELTTVPPTTQAAMLRLLPRTSAVSCGCRTTSRGRAASCISAPAMRWSGPPADRRSRRRWRTGCGTANSRWTTRRGAI